MSKLSTLKEQHPSLTVNLVEVLRSLDPSDTGKYMHFLIRNLYTTVGGKEEVQDYIAKTVTGIFKKKNIEALEKFEEYSKEQLIREDITTIEDFPTLLKHVENADMIRREKEMEREIQKWYEDEEWLVITPYTYEASKTYGRGTKWCTTSSTHFPTYTSGVLIYIINKKLTKNSKWAIYMHGNTWAVYDESDTRLFDTAFLPLSEQVRMTVTNIYRTFNGKNLEWVRCYHSPEHVFYHSRWKEIARLKPSVAEHIIQLYENPKVQDDALNQIRLECLRLVAAQPEPLKKEKPPRKSPTQPQERNAGWNLKLPHIPGSFTNSFLVPIGTEDDEEMEYEYDSYEDDDES